MPQRGVSVPTPHHVTEPKCRLAAALKTKGREADLSSQPALHRDTAHAIRQGPLGPERVSAHNAA